MISNFPDKSKFHLWKNHFLESKVADFDHHIQQLFIKHNRDNCNQRILVIIIPITTTGFEIPLAAQPAFASSLQSWRQEEQSFILGIQQLLKLRFNIAQAACRTVICINCLISHFITALAASYNCPCYFLISSE